MLITSLHAEDILSFSSFDIDFQQGLNVIVGPNGAGKSNVLRLVALIRTALDRARGIPNTSIDVRRFLRIGATQPRGKISLGVELTENVERSLMLGYVRALVASLMDRKTIDSPALDSTFEQLVAARVQQAVDSKAVENLCQGRLVLWLDAGPPETLGFAYEFDHDGTTYHYGLTGSGVPANWVAVGPAIPSRRSSWSGQSLDLSQFLSGSGEASFAFRDLLPAPEQLVPWEVKNHPTGHRLLLSEELARSLEAEPDVPLSLGFVLYRAIRDRLVHMENLRRPPRTVYALSEAGSSVSLDDAGDLPLELYRRRVGLTPEDRRAFQDVQELFKELTGNDIDIAAQATAVSRGPFTGQPLQTYDPPTYQFQIEAVVPVGTGQVPVQLAGAGVWEALVVSTFAVRVPGRVLLLDEPAANLHPTWQRRLLDHLASLDQVVLVTHSPYLVPGSKVEDPRRITRVRWTSAGTESTDLRGSAIPTEWLHRWRQDLASSADARATLFAQGVILLEGDTDHGAFSAWFLSDTVVDDRRNTYDAHNLSLIVAGSDKSFGAWVSYLRTFAIPWVILCDGPVLSPERETSLLEQLSQAGVDLGLTPDVNDAPFSEWKAFWERNGVFTVADKFGGVKDDQDKSGEIEAFFKRIDPHLWQEVYQRYAKSKVRAGYAFVEEVDLAAHSQELAELKRLWDAITKRLNP